MPPKRKAASKKVEATDSEDEPKSKKACAAPRPRAKKSRAYKMPPPLPSGQVLTDVTGKHSWTLGRSVGKGGFGEIYRASPSGSRKSLQHVIKIVCPTVENLWRATQHVDVPMGWKYESQCIVDMALFVVYECTQYVPFRSHLRTVRCSQR